MIVAIWRPTARMPDKFLPWEIPGFSSRFLILVPIGCAHLSILFFSLIWLLPSAFDSGCLAPWRCILVESCDRTIHARLKTHARLCWIIQNHMFRPIARIKCHTRFVKVCQNQVTPPDSQNQLRCPTATITDFPDSQNQTLPR